MKKQVSLLLILIILLSSNVYATNEINTPLVNSLETISIEDIPKNVKPLEFETEEELEGYLKMNVLNVKNKTNNANNPSLYSKTNTDSYTTSEIPASSASLNLKTLYHYEDDPEYRFTSSEASMSLTGFTMGLDLRDVTCSSEISKDKTSISTIGTCTIDHYFLIDGFVKFYSRDHDMDHAFTINDVF